jgi:hypothetical protein
MAIIYGRTWACPDKFQKISEMIVLIGDHDRPEDLVCHHPQNLLYKNIFIYSVFEDFVALDRQAVLEAAASRHRLAN